jgi:peptide methionine sulfoxide reductase msrA/msrB
MEMKRLILFPVFLFMLLIIWRCAAMSAEDNEHRVVIYEPGTGKTGTVDRIERSPEEWRAKLGPEEYSVLREKDTEKPFTNAYYASQESGLYRCAGCGTALFSSDDKFESGTGWPSYTRPVSEHNVRTRPDHSLFMRRTEVVCARCGGHLGHVFDDGPLPGGRRYCINSASLDFKAGPVENPDGGPETKPGDETVTGAGHGPLVPEMHDDPRDLPADSTDRLEKAVFAGGCFWCMQPLFDGLDGVVSATVGYTGGKTENPTYQQVITGGTGHAEAIEIVFDPEKIAYSRLLEIYFMNIDPTTENRQFADVGTQYRTVIFYFSDEQKKQAEAALEKLDRSGRFERPVVTDILPADSFYKAEVYHQFYYKKNPVRYDLYKHGSGRVDFLKRKWGKEKSGN